MGNLCSNSYDRNTLIRNLWKSLGAIPVLPINPNLDALRVLYKQSDGYHDVGNVHSLCKPGKHKEWLEDVVYPRRRLPLLRRKADKYLLPPRSIGRQTSVISDDNGALAKALVGPVNAAAWFTKSESIEVCIPDCEIREFNKVKWEEMIQHFDPDLQASILGASDWSGKREIFIVQKVLLVSQIKVTARYKSKAGVEVSAPVMPSAGVHAEAKFRTTSSSVIGEFTLTATQKNQKLPVAFSGYRYTYDRFGVREQYAKETRSQPDAADGEIGEIGEVGESSGASRDGDSEEEEEDPQNDPNMGQFLEDNEWFTTIIPVNDHNLEILPYLEEEEEEEEQPLAPGEEKEDEDVVVQNSSVPGLEDID